MTNRSAGPGARRGNEDAWRRFQEGKRKAVRKKTLLSAMLTLALALCGGTALGAYASHADTLGTGASDASDAARAVVEAAGK
jgi:hypothetical protein